MSVAEAAPQHPHLGHGIEGAGRVVALARNVGELGEVDPQVGELPQLCWGWRRGSEEGGTQALDAKVHRN